MEDEEGLSLSVDHVAGWNWKSDMGTYPLYLVQMYSRDLQVTKTENPND